MAWYLNGTRIFVTEINYLDRNIIAKINPLSGPTVYQKFGRESRNFKIGALIVGIDTLDALSPLADGFTPVALTTPEEVFSGYVASLEYNRLKSNLQNFDQTHDCEDPVFNISIEFWKEDNT